MLIDIMDRETLSLRDFLRGKLGDSGNVSVLSRIFIFAFLEALI